MLEFRSLMAIFADREDTERQDMAEGSCREGGH